MPDFDALLGDMYTRVAAQTGMMREEVKRMTHRVMYTPSTQPQRTLEELEAFMISECTTLVRLQQAAVSEMAELQEIADNNGWEI